MANESWTAERTLELMTLWNADWSSQQICQKFGISRSAVVGKIHRLRRKGHVLREERVTDAVRASLQRKRAKDAHSQKLRGLGVRPGAPIHPTPKSSRRHLLEKLLEESASAPKMACDPTPPKIKHIIDLEEAHCRWVIHHVDGNGWCGETRVAGLPYCGGHAARAYACVPASAGAAPLPDAPPHRLKSPQGNLRILEEA